MEKLEYELNYFKGRYALGHEVLYSFNHYVVTLASYPSRGSNYCVLTYDKDWGIFSPVEFADTLDQAIDLVFKRHFDEWVWAKDTTIERCPHCGKEEVKTRFYKLRYRTDKNHILCHTLVNENGVEVSIQKPFIYESCCSACYDERVALGLEEELPF